MKKICLSIVLLIFIIAFAVSFKSVVDLPADAQVLKASISTVPKSFFGVWRVVSKCVSTDSPAVFKEGSVDVWNILQSDNVITLKNPFTGASADVVIDKSSANHVVFTKKGNYANKVLTDVVDIKIEANKFSGTDTLQLDTLSDVSGKIIKTEKAKYTVKGEKLAGEFKTN